MDSLWRGMMLALTWTAAAAVVSLAAVVLITFPELPIESLLLGLGAAVVVSAGVAAGSAWVATRPTRQFLNHANEILAGREQSPELRVARQGDEAFGPLATAINTLLEELDERRQDIEAAQRERDLDKAEWSEKLRETREQFESAQARRDAFLARWRGSLTELSDQIQQAADRLLDVRLAPNERFERIETIRRAAGVWRERFTGIADLCAVETSSTPDSATTSPCEAQVFLEAVLRPISREARLRRVPLEITCDTDLPKTLEADAPRLSEALRQVSLAAFDLGDGQPLRLVVRWVSATEAQASGLRFRVVGCGERLSSLAEGAVFDPFGLEDNESDPLPQGARLALATAERLARQMQGHVELGRQASGHSALVLVVPCATEMETALSPAGEFELEQAPWKQAPVDVGAANGAFALEGRVLVAACGSEAADRIAAVLKDAGAQVETVGDGAAAYAKAVSAEDAGRPFDVVLLDDPLVELDVAAAASRLRHGAFSGMILVLADPQEAAERENWLAAGCDDVLVKPVDPRSLMSLLRRLVRPARPAQTANLPARRVEAGALTAAEDPASPIGAEAGRFVDDLHRWVGQLDQALGEGDLLALATVASQTRSAAGFWGLRPLAEAAERLEVYSQQNAGLESLVDCVEKLSSLCREVITTRQGDPAGQPGQSSTCPSASSR